MSRVQEDPPKHERWHDCGRRRRHQVVVGPSSHGGSVVCEAEFYSAGKAAAELIVIKSMMRDMGCDADIKLHVDATVAQAMANHQGIGMIRHLADRYLWLQEMAKSGAIAVTKMNGMFNPADVLTKPTSFFGDAWQARPCAFVQRPCPAEPGRGGVDIT